MEQRQRQTEGAILFLPLVVILNVLSRLPARSLARFQCVSKQWRSVINCEDDEDGDANYFLAMQQKHASSRPKIIDDIVDKGRVVIHRLVDDAEEPDKVEDKFFDLEILGYHRLSNSANGMFCAYRYDRLGSDFHLLNPTTREVSKLPDIELDRPIGMIGLGFDASTGVYKLVRTLILYKDIGYVHILTLGHDQEWRIGPALPLPRIYLDGPPVCLHGVLHWSAYNQDCNEYFILAFDIKKEKFEPSIPIPRVSASSSYGFLSSMGVKEWRGHIYVGVLYRQIDRIEIWMLKDYINHGWTEICNFKDHFFLSSLEKKLLAITDGKILIHFTCERLIRFLYVYDLKSKTFHDHEIYSSPSSTGWDVYNESLISPKKLLHNLSKKLQQ